MESLRSFTDITDEFRTPVRLLVPKLLKSRDDWKHKSQQRRAQNKALQINVRDLTASRKNWRDQYQKLLAEHQQLQAERDQLHDRVATLEHELADAKKK